MNTGGPAFPLAASTGDPRDGVYCQNGMSLLDYMAGQIMVGVISGAPRAGNHDRYAKDAYELAAAMLAEKARRERDSDSGIRTAQSDDGATVEFVIADSSIGKRMAKLEALNKELVEACYESVDLITCPEADSMAQFEVNCLKAEKVLRKVIAKAKEVA